jgi:hypothetical protein
MSNPDPLYDDYNDFYQEDLELNDHEDDFDDYNDDRDFDDENSGEIDWYDDGDDSMDGDAESAFGSCGWGTDEYYNPDNDYGDDW